MILEVSFSPHQHKKLVREWSKHYEQLRAAYEPVYRISRQYSTKSPGGQPLLLTDWINGRPTILPPADFVSVILYDPATQTLKSYLIEQPTLFELLGKDVNIEPLPTRFFQLESLTEPTRSAVLLNARLVGQKPLDLTTPPGQTAASPHPA